MSGFTALTASDKGSYYNPFTGEQLEQSVTYNCLNVKLGNTKKALDAYVTNVEQLTVYFLNANATEVRGLKITALKDGDKNATSEVFKVAGKQTEVCKIAINPSEKYKLSFTGVNDSGTSGADVYIVGIKFEVPSLTTAASTFSTYAASYPVNYKSIGLTAYAIGLDETAKKVTYTEIDGIVPANTPVLVKGEASKTYSLTKAEGDAATVATDLRVSDGTIVTEGGLYYAFSTVDGKSGFKKLADGLTIPAKKGYLKLTSANAKGFFDFDGETTGIKGIQNGTIDEEDTPLFNLAGQRVANNYKGIVIKNGKKFVNK